MSTLGSVLNSALKSMYANQLALAVASNNIANSGNPDFTRQRLVTQPSGPDGGAWSVGAGVDVVGVEAIRDALINARLHHEISAQFGSDTLAGRLGDIEAVFNDSNGTGLLQNITDFFNSFQSLSFDPASLPLREEVKTKANALISALHARDLDLSSIGISADKAIVNGVSEVNRLTGEIAEITKQINIEEITSPANDLRDRRAALVAELSQYLEVNELESGDEYQLTTKDNRLLILNDTARPLAIGDVTSALGTGSLAGNVELRDTYVPKYAGSLDQLAYEIAQQVNSIHSSAYDLDGNTGIDFFGQLTSATDAARLIDLSTDVAADTRKIAASSLPTGNDNGAAIALGNLIYAPVFSGGSVTDQYGALVFAVGADLSSAQSSVGQHQALLTQLQNRRQSISGVSIDEESLQIMQFQRAYQASAQLIKTVDELLQITLGLGA